MTAPTVPQPVAMRLSCGHRSTPTEHSPGYSVDSLTGSTLCYHCSAQLLIRQAGSMQPGDEPLVLYLRGPQPEPHQIAKAQLITWDGTVVGTAEVSRSLRGDPNMRVVARINGRAFWGKTPTHSGTYVRLRPYRHQQQEVRTHQ